MPIITPIRIYRGEIVTLSFRMFPKKDITGWVISFTVAVARNSTQKLFQVTANITNGPNGEFDVALNQGNTNINPGMYAWDVWRVNGPIAERILGEGDFQISKDARFP